MLNRSPLCAALIFGTSMVFAQEVSTPPASTPSSPAIAPSAVTTTGDMETKLAVSDSEEAGFLLPGGLGYAPLDFTPGQGRFDRKPLTYSTTVQLGYDDNINSTSGSRLQAPVKGSMLTTASEGVDLLLAQSRMGLSLGATAGGQYYWQRDSDKLTPLGSLNLVFGYKLTPRAQISALMNALYTTQPTQSVVNGFTRSNGKGYLVGSSKFDLLYSWAPRFSTDTFYSLNGTAQQAQELKSNDYTNQTVGQAFRYSLSQLVTGVFEGRYSQLTYRNIPSAFPSRDSDSYFLLAGADMTLTRRFFGSFRLGGSVRDYKAPDEGSSSSPYWESSLSYLASRFTTLNWDTRYGFDDGSSTSQKSRSVRTGVSLSHVFTPKLRGSIGVNYAHVSPEGGSDAFNVKKDDLNATIGGVYALSQCMTVFANVTHSRRSSPDPLQEMTKNIYYLGATYQY